MNEEKIIIKRLCKLEAETLEFYDFKKNYKVISYPFLGYWLDVGKHEDFEKAQADIHSLKF